MQSDDYTITYVNTADSTETPTQPTDVGTYKVKVTLTDSNFKFADGTEVEVRSKTFTMPDSDVTINVTFKKSSGDGGSSGGGNSGISTGTTPTSSPVPTSAPTSTSNPGTGSTLRPGTDAHEAYVYGYEDGLFRPENGITRAETAAIFARALTDYVEGTSHAGVLSDVVSTEWYAGYVNYLTGINVITGYEDGTFRPDNNITRAEAVKIVNAYLGRGVDAQGLTGADYVTFPDVETSHWAYYEIIEAANNHIYEEGNKPEIWTK